MMQTPITRDIAIAGRLLRTGGVLALLFGLALWAAIVSYSLFGALWHGGQKTEALYAALAREIGYQELFSQQARNVAIDTLLGSQAEHVRTAPIVERLLPELSKMPVGTARVVPGVAWDPEFEMVKRAPIGAARASQLALLTARFMLFDADFWDFDIVDDAFVVTPEGDFAAFRPVLGRGRLSAAEIDQGLKHLVAQLQAVFPEKSDAKDGPYWTRAYTHPHTGLSTVTSFVPVRDPAGRVILFVGSNVVPDKIVPNEVRATARAGESLLLVSDEGNVLAGSGDPALRQAHPSTPLVNLPLFGSALMRISVDHARVTFERHLPTNPWYVLYSIDNLKLLRDNGPMLAGATLLLLLYACGVWAATRHLRQRIIEPAQARTAALIERDAFTRTLIEAAPVGMAIIDPIGPSVVMANPCYIGTVDLIRQMSDGELLRVYRQLSSGVAARPIHRFVSAADADGERHYAVNLVDAVFRERPVLIGIVSDVTEQRRFELEQRKARLAAESANKAKDGFLATVSHEMRTPLYGTLASLELLGKQALDDEKRYYVDVMESSTRNLLDLINDLLDYSRIQVDRFELNPRDCVLLKELESVGLSFTGRARLQGLTLDWMIDPALAHAVHTDASRLGQVITNLVGNAIKFTPAGHVAFSARVMSIRDNGCDVEFRVSDSGIGIDAHDLPDLFQPFGKIAAGQGMQHGTGLGLAISRQFVEMLGGAIAVESESGRGTSLHFVLQLPWAHAVNVPRILPVAQGVRTFGFMTEYPRREWFLEALVRHAGFVPVRYASPTAWTGGRGLSDDDGLLLFGDEWPIRGMMHDHVYLLRPTPIDRRTRPAMAWPHNLALLQQTDTLRMLRGPGAGAVDGLPVEGVQAGEPPDASEQPMGGWYVLVVDDHPISGMLLTRQLEVLGAVVDCYHDPREALDAFDEASHMLVMTDANMPHLSGRELAVQLKRRAPDIPVIVVTADVTLPADKEPGTPFDAVLYKPVDAGGLARAVDALQARFPALNDMLPLDRPTERTPDATFEIGTSPSADLLDSFVVISDADLDQCRIAIAAEDRAHLRHCAHRLRGGFMAFGLSGMAEFAAQLEHCAPHASRAQMEGAFTALEAAWTDWLRRRGHGVAA
ncbi:Sensor histidine kinase RcsC [Pandoraea terrae]|uniref:histidine kinase n=1 Tax=Pandoraea terrae TaxID=1537710 RepID=A0A5E4ZEQ3_9BURK|nr:ATP-binding protein [Pandoraea terrae]VVE59554.1 Sensor histidine kinase RcsC [Pandoraea terrae]